MAIALLLMCNRLSTLAAGAFNPVEVAQVYSSDKYSENPVITVSNSLNSKTATVTANFTAATGGLVAVKANPSSVNSVIGGSQNITFTAQDAYGNPIANQTIYLGTGIPGCGLLRLMVPLLRVVLTWELRLRHQCRRSILQFRSLMSRILLPTLVPQLQE